MSQFCAAREMKMAIKVDFICNSNLLPLSFQDFLVECNNDWDCEEAKPRCASYGKCTECKLYNFILGMGLLSM